eukprot:8270765-Ditylum_brightwellii.AAC.1
MMTETHPKMPNMPKMHSNGKLSSGLYKPFCELKSCHHMQRVEKLAKEVLACADKKRLQHSCFVSNKELAVDCANVLDLMMVILEQHMCLNFEEIVLEATLPCEGKDKED